MRFVDVFLYNLTRRVTLSTCLVSGLDDGEVESNGTLSIARYESDHDLRHMVL
jgi:hypothetical protein